METPNKLFIVTTMLLLSFSASPAQDNWQVILNSGDTLNACIIDSLHDNVLSMSYGTFIFPVDSIAALIEHKEGHFWKGAVIGTLGGAFAGGVISPMLNGMKQNIGIAAGEINAAEFGGLIGAVGGFVVGGVIGASSSIDASYILIGKTQRDKLNIIRYLLSQ